ncbi:GTP-binding protein [Pseudomonas sp. LB1P83]
MNTPNSELNNISGTVYVFGDKSTVNNLTDALRCVCSKASVWPGLTPNNIDSPPEKRARDITINTAHAEHKSSERHYAHVDAPTHASYVTSMIDGPAREDGAILAVAATDGPMQFRKHILSSRQAGISNLVVFVNNTTNVDDENQLAFLMTLRNELDINGYSGSDTPVIIGSALMALEGQDNNQMGTTAVKKLVETMDTYIRTSEHAD